MQVSLAMRTWTNKNVIKSTMYQASGAYSSHSQLRFFYMFIAIRIALQCSVIRIHQVKHNEFHKFSSVTRLDLYSSQIIS